MIKEYILGKEFYSENEAFLNENFLSQIQTVFFKSNSMRVHPQNVNSFAFTIESNAQKIACLNEPVFHSLLYGSISLAREAAMYAAHYDFLIQKVIGEESLIKEFSMHYCKEKGCSFSVLQQMSILYLRQLKYKSVQPIMRCRKEEFLDLVPLIIEFHREALNEIITQEMALDFLNNNEQNIFYLKLENQIVSMAMLARNDYSFCAISHVFTAVKHRGKGYAKEVVSFLAHLLLEEKKIPYLYVDKTNPISNHLYLSIGFELVCDQMKVAFH